MINCQNTLPECVLAERLTSRLLACYHTSMIRAMAKNLINLVYPIHCAVCNKALGVYEHPGVCPECRSKIRPNPKPSPERKSEKLHFDKAYSAYLYEDSLKELIHMFKYNKRISLAKMLSGLMSDFIKNNREVSDGIDTITFVPLTNSRLRERGFNQSKMLAGEIAKDTGIPILDLLEKTSSTKPQNELTRDERFSNLKDVFKVRRNAEIKNLRILLIDDVMTTGATFSECAKALISSGAKEVTCLALARGL